jgi:Ca2+-binding RTX toxin-like protein
MSFTFTSSQKNTIIAMRTSIENGTLYNNKALKYGDIYNYMESIARGKSGVDEASLAWLRGAADINRGEGAASEFIRNYTNQQSIIRFGNDIDPAKMQEISNEIAKSVIADALSLNTIPSISRIAEYDANKVASGFFSGDKAAWSGNMLFTVLGYTQAFDQNILPDTYNIFAMAKAAKIAFDTTDFWSSLNLLSSNFNYTGFVESGATAILTDNKLESVYGSSAYDLATISRDNIILDQLGRSTVLGGGSNNDFIHMADGDDTISGSPGKDIIDGGTGIDKLDYSGQTAGIYLNLFAGKVTDSIPSNAPIIVNVEQVTGTSGNDTIIGSSEANTIDGGKGNDTLKGGEGNDTFIISAGNDIIDDTGVNDVLSKFAGVGVETTQGSNVYQLSDNATAQVIGTDMIITHAEGILTLTNWKTGDYGITLEPSEQDKGKSEVNETDTYFKYSPIALDLSKDGFINQYGAYLGGNNVFFDMDNDGFREKAEWIYNRGDAGSYDGWLVLDRNGNGKIDNQREMFGVSDGLSAYQKLAQLNTNNTGTSANAITAADTGWSSLRIWQDANMNGVSEATELKTLASFGITALNLPASLLSLTSTFVMNGTHYLAQDIFVSVDQKNSWYSGKASEVSSAALKLSASRGYGDVKSLHYAATASTALFGKVAELQNMSIAGLDSYYLKLETMLETWAGTTGASPVGINNFVDWKHKATWDKFSGGINEADTIREGFALEKNYDEFLNDMSVRFVTQGALKAVFNAPIYNFYTDKIEFNFKFGSELSTVLTNAKAYAPTDTADKSVYWSEVARTIFEYHDYFDYTGNITKDIMQQRINEAAGFNVKLRLLNSRIMIGDAGNNTISGNAGSQYIDGLDGNDVISGNGGDDVIFGGNGNDTIKGGTGNDTLESGDGNDSYRFAAGDGNDTVYDYSGTKDELVFENLTLGQVTVSRVDDVTYKINTSGTDAIVFSRYHIESARFSDGKVVTIQQLVDMAAIVGTSGYDFLTGTDAPNRMYGLEGNDRLSGKSGNDTIEGGVGADTLNGDGGDDLIVGGNDNDALYGGVGADIIRAEAGNDIVFAGEGNDSINGGDGDDNIYGETGNDIIDGESGNNKLNGEAGNDILSSGVGNDNISGGDGDDLINSGDGKNTIYTGAGSDTVNSGSGDDYIYDAKEGNNTIRSGGGADYVYGGVNQDSIIGGAGNDSLHGFDGDDSLNGEADNDKLFGGKGNDVLSGGIGNDTIEGGDGSDILFGQNGVDRLIGGAGADTFFFAATDSQIPTATSSYDTVTDFQNGSDKFNVATFVSSFSELTVSYSSALAKTLIVSSSDNFGFALNGNIVSQIDAGDFIFA